MLISLVFRQTVALVIIATKCMKRSHCKWRTNKKCEYDDGKHAHHNIVRQLITDEVQLIKRFSINIMELSSHF